MAKKWKSGVGRQLRQVIIDSLAEEGERIMQECLAEKEYNNVTGALASSYGWAVYYHGKIVKANMSDDVQIWRKKFNGEYISGADMINELLDPYTGKLKVPSSSNSMGLIIISAVPYGPFLEEGHTFSGRKYKVISMSYDKLMEIKSKYGKASVKAIIDGKAV